MIPVFQNLSEKIGKQNVIWRYDPIFFSDRYTKEYHLKAFKSIAEALSGYTEKCVISFVDVYPKNKKNMDGLSSYELNDDELREFAQELSKIATDNNIITPAVIAIKFAISGLSFFITRQSMVETIAIPTNCITSKISPPL